MSDLARRIRDHATGSVIPKVLLIAFLVLILLIPLAMIRSLVDERSARRSQAEEEIVRQAGGEQTIAGPLLIVPFIERTTDERGRVEETVRDAFFLPDTLEVDGSLAPELRRRGIYEVTLFESSLTLRGTFRTPDFSRWRIPQADVLWDDAAVFVEVAGMPGVRERVRLDWDGRSSDFAAARGETGLFAGAMRAHVPAAALSGVQEHAFALELALRGGKSLGFIPVGDDTRVRLASSWPAPSFAGAFLPARRSWGPAGFTAEWHVLSLGRSTPQAWRAGDIQAAALRESRFAVDLPVPVDAYLKSERSVKHGILFVLLPFLALFLFEVGARVRVHAMQYLLIGLAECVFYLLLLALSEHMSFDLAYMAASVSTVALVSAYAAAVLGGWRRAAVLPPLLAAAYGILYAALRSEDYALLIGSLGLFAILATVMMLTRKVDWYRLGRTRETGATPSSSSSARP